MTKVCKKMKNVQIMSQMGYVMSNLYESTGTDLNSVREAYFGSVSTVVSNLTNILKV